MIAYLLKCICVNGILHIVYTVVTNEYVNNKTSELQGVRWLPVRP
jgi:hypothetical protein